MDNVGLMRPGPTVASQEDEERRRRESGYLGLMAAMAEPLTYAPNPFVSAAAQTAKQVGDKGWATGLASGAADLAMNLVTRNGPGKLNMYQKVKSPKFKDRAAETRYNLIRTEQQPKLDRMAKNLYGDEAREFYHSTGQWVDTAGNKLREFSDHQAKPTDKLLEKVAQQLLNRDPNFTITDRNSEFFDHPELYMRYPEMADYRISLGIKPGSSYYSGQYSEPSKKATIYIPGKETDDNILRTWLHEMQHAVQNRDDLPKGANPKAIEWDLTNSLLHHGAKATDVIDLGDAIKAEAKNRYLLTEGELGANMTERRDLMTPQQRKLVYPPDSQTWSNNAPVQSGSRVLSPYDPAEIDRIARRLLGIPENP